MPALSMGEQTKWKSANLGFMADLFLEGSKNGLMTTAGGLS
jgi:hypothetical protein